MMKHHYWREPGGNFGDDLNPWLWPRLLPQVFDDARTDVLFMGIGTLIHAGAPEAPIKHVLGSGFGYGERPASLERWRFHGVRGPLSARALGLPDSLAIGDPAILVRRFAPRSGKTGRVGFMPHVSSEMMGDWAHVAAQAGLDYVDPRAPVDVTLEQIAGLDHLVTEALHGAIVADALRTPWTPVCSSPLVLHSKWQDWCASLGMEHRPKLLPAHHRGDAHLGPCLRLKNRAKRLALFLGLDPVRLTLPPPPASTPGQTDAICAILSHLARGDFARLSSDAAIDRAETRLSETVDRFIREELAA